MSRRIACFLSRSLCQSRTLYLSLGLLLSGLSACSGAPTRFYTLVPPALAVSAPTQDPAFQIAVQAVGIPAQVDVQQMVVREAGGALTPVETRRWIAPLSAEIRAALVSALTRRLGVSETSGVAQDERVPTYIVQLNVQRFDSSLGGSAQIEAVWNVRNSRDATRSATCASRVSVPVGPGYEALAEGHQRALVKISDSIARALLALQSGNAVSACADAAP